MRINAKDPECVVITGTSRGIGLALAQEAVAQGYQVIGIQRSLNPKPTRDLLWQIVEIQDISDETELYVAASKIKELTKKIDLIVNCAGVSSKTLGTEKKATYTFGALQRADLTRMFEVNTIGPILLSQQLIELLKPSQRPCILNISSRDASFSIKTTGGNYGYTASKVALNMMTKILANDIKPLGIRVAAVHPGWVRTQMGVHQPRPHLRMLQKIF